MIPHFEIPFKIGVGGSVKVLDQDSLDEVSQCVSVLLATTYGSRIELPEYGIPNPVMTSEEQVQPHILSAQVEKWEPRARTVISSKPDDIDALIRHLQVRVKNGTNA